MAGLVIWRKRDRDLNAYGDWRKIWKEDYEESSYGVVYKEMVT